MKRLPTEQPILSIFSVGYLVAFVAFGLISALSQTFFYATFMVAAFALVVMTYSRFRLRQITLWGLALWGIAHLAGGLLSIGADFLYRFDLIPGLLRFDQVVHAFGFGFATAACWDVLGEVIVRDRAVNALFNMILGAGRLVRTLSLYQHLVWVEVKSSSANSSLFTQKPARERVRL